MNTKPTDHQRDCLRAALQRQFMAKSDDDRGSRELCPEAPFKGTREAGEFMGAVMEGELWIQREDPARQKLIDALYSDPSGICDTHAKVTGLFRLVAMDPDFYGAALFVYGSKMRQAMAPTEEPNDGWGASLGVMTDESAIRGFIGESFTIYYPLKPEQNPRGVNGFDYEQLVSWQ